MDTLMLKNDPLLNIHDDGTIAVIDFDRLPFALRIPQLSSAQYKDWVSLRALQLDRQHAKDIINRYRLPQYDKYRIAKACRGFSLTDSYWIRDEMDTITWEDRNLFHNDLSLSIVETSLSGKLSKTSYRIEGNEIIHEISPELTTWGVNAKAWIKETDGLYLHKIGINEVGASVIIDMLGLEHIKYQLSTAEQIDKYLSTEVKTWLTGVGEAIVNSKLFTSENLSFVSFDEFSTFCSYYDIDPIDQAIKYDARIYYEMQIIDYILNNPDRHGQNWGFYMDANTGKLVRMALHFDHDRAFNRNIEIMSLTSKEPMLLRDAALDALSHVRIPLENIRNGKRPPTVTEKQWQGVQERVQILDQ
ncbi:hypothetical protein M2150_001741 [Lachnospiraceae bacterium PM6-15]|uniref:HipA-like C-terminal domain-containing protein n=1 Tax=Ohessyouella blattaphilus TaxID=2949333 RepID=A0ABT1EM28_9FIRM|nr:hypothetical protein [Ohessyouella blattaphilus]MCP1110862.1 hypothetical protein [Ohessyouella blattaphilus]MCR8564256.1 hypothetical protein [Ohessyouella blattaphilus]